MVEKNSAAETDRRAFLKGAGKYAVAVPPAMTFLLSTTLVSEAVAQSAGANQNSPSFTQGSTSPNQGSASASGSGNGSGSSAGVLAGLAAAGVAAENVCVEILGECL